MTSSVLVRITGPDPKGIKSQDRPFFYSEAGRTTFSCSGFICNSNSTIDGWNVWTSASCLTPFLKDNASCELLETVDIVAYLDDGKQIKCVLKQISQSSSVVNAVNRLLRIPVGDSGSCSIAILSPEDEMKHGKIRNVCNVSSKEIKRGSPITLVSSPFGLVSPLIFQNSITKGIICNIITDNDNGEEEVLYLTDARALPGSEGGAALDDEGNIIGMIMPSIRRNDATEFELGIIIPVNTIANTLGMFMDQKRPIFHDLTKYQSNKRTQLSDAVVLVKIFSSWGSGVAIDEQGHILTCAHVLKPFTKIDPNSGFRVLKRTPSPIVVIFRDSHESSLHERRATLVYCSDGPLDIAVVKVDGIVPAIAQISKKLPKPGETCWAIGHSIFEPSLNLGCTITQGVVSKVVFHPHWKHMPVMYQSSANVFRGHSGGMLANSDGQLIGILTSNARHSSGAIIASINFTLPCHLIAPLMRCLQEDPLVRDRVFHQLDKERDPDVMSIWQLDAGALRPELPPAIPEESSFGEFLKHFSKL